MADAEPRVRGTTAPDRLRDSPAGGAARSGVPILCPFDDEIMSVRRLLEKSRDCEWTKPFAASICCRRWFRSLNQRSHACEVVVVVAGASNGSAGGGGRRVEEVGGSIME